MQTTGLLSLGVLVALAAVVAARQTPPQNKGIPHFDMSPYDDDYKKYKVRDGLFPETDEECDKALAQKDAKCIHKHARVCVTLMHKTNGPAIRECEAEGSELADSDQAWQEASGKWHKGMFECMKADRPDEPVQDSMYMFRKKRAAYYYPRDHHGDHGHHQHGEGCGHGEYEETEEGAEKCWKDVRKHVKHAKKNIAKCTKFAACLGVGEEPSDASDKAWYTYQKQLVDAKMEAIVNHKLGLLKCLGKIPEDATAEHVRAHMWGHDSSSSSGSGSNEEEEE